MWSRSRAFRRGSRFFASDSALRAASAKAVTTVLNIMHETQQNYFNAVGLRRETQILIQRNSRLGELLKVTEARLAAGEGTKLDVATLKAEQATAAIDLSDVTLKIRRAHFSLAHRLGQPRGRIDWILVGGPVEVRSVETVVHHAEGRYPSDHYPVMARVEIRE